MGWISRLCAGPSSTTGPTAVRPGKTRGRREVWDKSISQHTCIKYLIVYSGIYSLLLFISFTKDRLTFQSLPSLTELIVLVQLLQGANWSFNFDSFCWEAGLTSIHMSYSNIFLCFLCCLSNLCNSKYCRFFIRSGYLSCNVWLLHELGDSVHHGAMSRPSYGDPLVVPDAE